MRLRDFEKAFSKDNLLADLCAASAAGLVAALATLAFKLFYYKYVSLVTPLWYLLLGVTTYFVVALFLNRFWRGLPRRIVPSWLMIGLLGSIVFVLARLTPGIIGGWYDPLRLESSFKEYLSTELSAAQNVLLFFWVITIPTAGLAYYGVSIAKVLKRRRSIPQPERR